MSLKEVKQHLRESESLGPTHSTPGSPLFTAKWPSQPPKGPRWTEEMQEQRQKAGAGHGDPSQRGSSRAEGRLPAAHALGAKVLLRNSSLYLRQMYNTVALSSWQTGYYGGTLWHEAGHGPVLGTDRQRLLGHALPIPSSLPIPLGTTWWTRRQMGAWDMVDTYRSLSTPRQGGYPCLQRLPWEGCTFERPAAGRSTGTRGGAADWLGDCPLVREVTAQDFQPYSGGREAGWLGTGMGQGQEGSEQVQKLMQPANPEG